MKKSLFSVDWHSISLFFKSAAITAVSIAIAVMLVIGILNADKNTNAAVGKNGGASIQLYDDYTFKIELFGKDKNINIRPLKNAFCTIQNYAEFTTPEARLTELFFKKTTDFIKFNLIHDNKNN